MYQIDQKEFEALVTDSIEGLPKERKDNIKNVAFMVENEPTEEQRAKLNLRPCQSLFGLYEGVPLTERRGGYAMTLPDRITVYKNTHELFANSYDELAKQVKKTVWHELAHYYGLDHDRIEELENGRNS